MSNTKKRYYLLHDGSDFVWTERLTEEELNVILNNGECIDLINKELFNDFRSRGYAYEIN